MRNNAPTYRVYRVVCGYSCYVRVYVYVFPRREKRVYPDVSMYPTYSRVHFARMYVLHAPVNIDW